MRGGLVHIGLGNSVENACCLILGGLLELEAAVCLCIAIRLKLLNNNIFIPLAPPSFNHLWKKKKKPLLLVSFVLLFNCYVSRNKQGNRR
ncbi:hypothetical protein GQ457_16G026840 [Hibiscus cannabinus]